MMTVRPDLDPDNADWLKQVAARRITDQLTTAGVDPAIIRVIASDADLIIEIGPRFFASLVLDENGNADAEFVAAMIQKVKQSNQRNHEE